MSPDSIEEGDKLFPLSFETLPLGSQEEGFLHVAML